MLKDENGHTTSRGRKSDVPAHVEFPTFTWDPDDWNASIDRLRREIEAAGSRADAQRVT